MVQGVGDDFQLIERRCVGKAGGDWVRGAIKPGYAQKIADIGRAEIVSVPGVSAQGINLVGDEIAGGVTRIGGRFGGAAGAIERLGGQVPGRVEDEMTLVEVGVDDVSRRYLAPVPGVIYLEITLSISGQTACPEYLPLDHRLRFRRASGGNSGRHLGRRRTGR